MHTDVAIAGRNQAKVLGKPASAGAFLATMGGAAWCLLLGLLWNYEESSKVATLAVALSVFSLGLFVLRIGKKAGIVHSERDWTIAFLLKLTLSFLITMYAWAAPLSPEFLRVPNVVEGLQDS